MNRIKWDRHLLGALIYAGVLTVNHRLNLALTVTELFLLAAALGVDQVVALVKALKEPTK